MKSHIKDYWAVYQFFYAQWFSFYFRFFFFSFSLFFFSVILSFPADSHHSHYWIASG